MTMTHHALAKKLGLKPGMVVVLEGAPEGYLASLGPSPDAVEGPRFVQSFVRNTQELARCAARITADETATLWVTYPKKTSGMATDLSRDVVREMFSAYGWIAVSIVSVDDVWSALRFRPKAAVKTTRAF